MPLNPFAIRPCSRLLLVALVLCFAASFTRAQAPTYGNNQSPINIVRSQTPQGPAPSINISGLTTPVDLSLKNYIGAHWCNDGSCKGIVDARWATLKAAPHRKDVRIRVNGALYTLQEFHFHSPAEHLIDGNLTEMEIHLVFLKDGQNNCGAGQLVVLGKRIVSGTPTPEVNEQINKIFGPTVVLPVNYSNPATEVYGFDISKLLDGIGREFLYSGSLTAPANLPNCSNPPGNPDQQLASGYLPEVVSWVLFDQPLILSAAQIARFQQLFPNGDARAPQPLHEQHPTRTF